MAPSSHLGPPGSRTGGEPCGGAGDQRRDARQNDGVSRDLGIPGAPSAPSSAPTDPSVNGVGAPRAGAPAPPRALRSGSPGWRDPRLWVGVAIVAGSVVAGSRVLAAADDTVAVWSVASDMAVGDTVTTDDLVARQVRFAEADDLARYVTVEQTLPADLALVRDLGAGELLPRAAVGAEGGSGTVLVRIAVEDEQIPAAVARGSRVHVYLLGPGRSGRVDPGAGEPALAAVTVVEAPAVSDNLAATGNRTIDVVVSEEQAQAYFADRAALESPTVTVVKVGE